MKQHEGLLFRSDAKAEGDSVCIRGWECRGGISTENARWFSVELNQENAPWIFCKGEPFKIISALELLSTLVSVMVFIPPGAAQNGAFALSGTGATDNKGNSYVVKKLMTTAFPLSACLMELSEQLELRASWLDLEWVPRQQNIEAGALTSGHFAAFSSANRIVVDMKSLPFVVLTEMIEAGGGMLAELAGLREKKRLERAEARKAKRARKRLAGMSLKDRDPW